MHRYKSTFFSMILIERKRKWANKKRAHCLNKSVSLNVCMGLVLELSIYPLMFEISVEIGIFAIKLSLFWFPFEFLALFWLFLLWFYLFKQKEHYRHTPKKMNEISLKLKTLRHFKTKFFRRCILICSPNGILLIRQIFIIALEYCIL